MEEMKEIIMEGERQADPSIRFASHQAGNPLEGIMEAIHNMLTYGKKHGEVKIKSIGNKLYSYDFYNDGDIENIPTFKRIFDISHEAGQGMSSGEGLSLCGAGIEVMGLSSRPFAKSDVTAEITVVREGFEYGAFIYFNGKTLRIGYKLKYPKKCEGKENSFRIVYKGCKGLSKDEITELKRRIVDTMSNNGFEIELSVEKETYKLTYRDFIYEKELKGTDYYKEIEYYLEENKEPITVKMVDVRDLISSGRGNEYEDSNSCASSLSGGAFRLSNGMATICRGKEGWKFSGAYKDVHSTRNGIRFDIIGGETIFHALHEESQVKIKTNTSIKELLDEHYAELKIVSKESGEVFGISQIAKDIKVFSKNRPNIAEETESVNNSTSKEFTKPNKSVSEDTTTSVSTQKVPSTFLEAIDNGTITLKKIEETLNYFRNIFEKHEVIKHFKSEYEDILDEMYEEIIEPLMNDKEVLEHARKRERKTDFDLILEAADNIISEKCYTRAK